jgi:NUDIX domain
MNTSLGTVPSRSEKMKTTVLVIGVVKKGDTVLLRKKPDGSPPYKETWYLFGAEINAENPEKALQEILKKQTGISVNTSTRLGWDTETKPDHEGKLTFYIYLDYLCEYISGELVPGQGIEKLEWVHISKLPDYDLVPPSKKLFKRIGYL